MKNPQVLMAMEIVRWLYSVRRDIHANAQLQVQQRVAYPEKSSEIEAQAVANDGEYRKTLAAVEKALNPALEGLFSGMGIDIYDEITQLKQGAEKGDIDFYLPDFTALKR